MQGGAILHCFDWSYNAIKANLADIKAAGYTAVQTSPVQPPKDYSASYTESSSNWWKLYQPLDLCVAESGSWLGTKDELTEMCAEAETYGIKVIVDIVSNHLANNGSVGTGKFTKYLHADVNSELKKDEYFFGNVGGVSSDSRYRMTHGHLGMPELNTANAVIQQRVLAFLKECVDCGVDGFRFDTAKHIELPTDDEQTRANQKRLLADRYQRHQRISRGSVHLRRDPQRRLQQGHQQAIHPIHGPHRRRDRLLRRPTSNIPTPLRAIGSLCLQL